MRGIRKTVRRLPVTLVVMASALCGSHYLSDFMRTSGGPIAANGSVADSPDLPGGTPPVPDRAVAEQSVAPLPKHRTHLFHVCENPYECYE